MQSRPDNSKMKELKIIQERQNPLFNRIEVQIGVFAEKIPSHKDSIKVISEKFSAPEENIKIKKIGSKFGSKDFIISANIYSSKEDKDQTEIKTQKEIEKEKKARQTTVTEEKEE